MAQRKPEVGTSLLKHIDSRIWIEESTPKELNDETTSSDRHRPLPNWISFQYETPVFIGGVKRLLAFLATSESS